MIQNKHKNGNIGNVVNACVGIVKGVDSAKLIIDKALDNAAIPVATNSAYLCGMIYGMNELSKVLESLEAMPDSLKPIAVTLLAVGGLYPLNRYVTHGLSKTAGEYNNRRSRRNKGSGLIGWGKTALLASALAYTLPRIELGSRIEQPQTNIESGFDDRLDDRFDDEAGVREEHEVAEGLEYSITDRQVNMRQPRINICQERYVPSSEAAIQLFEYAAERASLPIEWARSDALHNLLREESQGWVGRPNYTIELEEGSDASDLSNRSRWQEVHRMLREGRIQPRSTATGLGQLILPNIDSYYPSGRIGMGDCVEEAIGMLRYISDRYGNPETAWQRYNSAHEGY